MIQPQFSQILAIYSALLLFGVIYNLLISQAEKRGWIEGYTALAVIAGVLVVIGAIALIDTTAALVALGAFTAAGAPMAAGSVFRHMRTREKAQRRMIEEINE
jgi:hypothetical protein